MNLSAWPCRFDFYFQTKRAKWQLADISERSDGNKKYFFMKRVAFLRYLHEQGCFLIREGKKHSVFINPKEKRTSTVPRHNEINNFLAVKICKDLGIPSA